MKKNIDVSYEHDEKVTLRDFMKQYEISINDNVIIQDFFLREYPLKNFLKDTERYNAIVDEALLEDGCLTISVQERY